MPMQDKTDPATGRRAYRCYNDFEALKWREVRGMLPKIVDFGLATRLESGDLTGKEEIGIHPIQPDHYHAPEVVLGCGWGFKTDIWNFGVLTWNIIERTKLFRQVRDPQGRYDAKAHIAKMIALLGPPPQKLLARSNALALYQWPEPFKNDAGKLCNNAREFFGGFLFNKESRPVYIRLMFAPLLICSGRSIHKSLIPDRNFETETPASLENEENNSSCFLSDRCLTWLPEERKSAR